MGNKRAGLPAALALLAGALAAGCAHKATVVGTWSGTTTVPQGGTIQTTLALTGDGKMTRTAQISSGARHFNMSGSGTYTVTGTSMTQTFSTININGQTAPIPANQMKPEVDQFKLDGDTLTITEPNNPTPQVLTRQKS